MKISSPRSPMIVVRGATKVFGGLTVLRDLNLSISSGEVVCLMGPSGSGKTTFLRCVNHLERLDYGTIEVDGELIGYQRRNGRIYENTEKKIARQRVKVGMVFQRFNLFPHLSVLENVTIGQTLVIGRNKTIAEKKAKELLTRIGLADKTNQYPEVLSGGQQQRVAIARALSMDPKLMLFDEPTSALDPELVGEVLEAIESLAESGMTMLIVTHEVNFAREVADRVIFMADGAVVEDGPARDVIDSPKTPRAREFFSSVL